MPFLTIGKNQYIAATALVNILRTEGKVALFFTIGDYKINMLRVNLLMRNGNNEILGEERFVRVFFMPLPRFSR